MARGKNTVETHQVRISTTEWAIRTLDALAKTGRFGKNPSDVAEELLRSKLRDVEQEGWVEPSRTARRNRRA